MRESYYVGFDPQLKIWEVMSVTPDYPDDFWVFKVSARNEGEALSKGLMEYQAMTATPSDESLEVMRHAHRQALRLNTGHRDLFAIDIPVRLLAEADKLVRQGFFMPGHDSQVIVNPTGPGWKALEYHLSAKPRPAMPHEASLAFG